MLSKYHTCGGRYLQGLSPNFSNVCAAHIVVGREYILECKNTNL